MRRSSLERPKALREAVTTKIARGMSTGSHSAMEAQKHHLEDYLICE